MNIIKISDKILRQTPKYTGYESNIYEVDGVLLKIFKTYDLKTLKNKRDKIEIIHTLDIDDPKPIDLIEINGEFKGYSIEKTDYHILDVFKGSKKEKLEILKKN